MFTATKEDNIATMKNSASKFGNAANNVASETANDVQSELRDAAGSAGRKVREFVNHAGDELTHAKDTVTTQIRSNPVQASLIALGAGFVLGALLRR